MMLSTPALRLLLAPALLATLGGVVGCGETPPPIPRGAWYVSFINPGGGVCDDSSHEKSVGKLRADNLTTTVADGAADTEVSCNIARDGSSYGIEADIRVGVSRLTVSIPKIDAKASGTAAAVNGAVTFVDAETVEVYASLPGTPCTFYFAEDTDQGVTPSEFWASFACPAVIQEGEKTCRIETGIVYIRGCSQEAEAEEG